MATNISTLKINASRQRVWDTITKPELVKLWQYGSDLTTSWEIGSDIKFRTMWEGNVFEQWGKVLEIKPNKLKAGYVLIVGEDEWKSGEVSLKRMDTGIQKKLKPEKLAQELSGF